MSEIELRAEIRALEAVLMGLRSEEPTVQVRATINSVEWMIRYREERLPVQPSPA